MDYLNIKRSLVKATITFIIGIIIGYYTTVPLTWSLLLLGGLFLLWGLIGYFNPPFFKIITFCLIFVIGIIWFDFNDPQPNVLQQWAGKNIKVTGEVISIVQQNNQLILQLAKVNDRELKSKPKILIKPKYKNETAYVWGELVTFSGYLTETMPKTNPGGFSEKEYWRQKGIRYKLVTFEAGKVEHKKMRLKVYIHKMRQSIYQIVKENLPEKEGGVVLGLILGDKSEIDKSFYDYAQKLGIAHIFAVSGLHVGFLMALYLALTKWFKLSDTLTLLGAVVILAMYSIATGLTPSVIRASIMALLALAAFKWLKYKDFYTLLAVAALIILIYNPLNLFTVGFQLSFITTWGLVYFFPLAEEMLRWIPEKIRPVLAVPLAAQISSLPVVVYHFNLVSIWAPIMNLLIVPIIAILVPLLFGTLALAAIWVGLAKPFLLLAGGIVYALYFVIEQVQGFFSNDHFYLAKPHLGAVFLYFLLLIACREIDWLKTKLSINIRLALISLLILTLLFITLPGLQPLEVTFLDVGQGDGAVLETPLHKIVVIDSGPVINTVVRYLQHKGVNQVALAILSHPDNDHIKGFFKMLEEISTEVLLVPPDVEGSPALTKLKNLARQKNTKIIEGKVGMVCKMPSGVNVSIISPDLKKFKNLDSNNASLVVNCTYGKQDVLFTGDIENQVLKKILPKFKNIEVVKIPHHGSKGSYFNGLYEKMAPQVAVISAGRGNRYGHPHKSVLLALEKNGIKAFRTDIQGAIILKLDGDNIKIDTMLK